MEREIGEEFVRQYYTTYSKNPAKLASMYSMASVFCHAPAGKTLEITQGRQDITNKLSGLAEENGLDCKFNILQADCVPSINGAIMILVQGVMLTTTSARDFAHSFLLGKTADGGYYIHNDIMKIVEEVEDEYEEEEEEEEEEEVPEAAAPAAAPAAAAPESTAAARVEEAEAALAAAEEPAAEEEEKKKEAEPSPAAPREEVEAEQEEEQPPAPEEKKPRGPSSWASIVTRTGAPAETTKAVRVTAPQSAVVSMPGDKRTAKGAKRMVAAAVSGKGEGKGVKGVKGSKGEKGAGKGEKGADAAGKHARRSRSDSEVNYNYHSLYVSRLPQSFKEADIETVFGQFGTIKGKKFQDGHGSSAGGRRCFVDYETKDAVLAALKAPVVWQGATLNVQERKSPAQRQEEKEKEESKRGPRKPGLKQ